MTLLHTKGYSEVLESVKMRAQKKAVAMARMAVNVKVATVLESLRQIANTIVLLAAGEIEDELADVPNLPRLWYPLRAQARRPASCARANV